MRIATAVARARGVGAAARGAPRARERVARFARASPPRVDAGGVVDEV
jgi:hypothetical protein